MYKEAAACGQRGTDALLWGLSIHPEDAARIVECVRAIDFGRPSKQQLAQVLVATARQASGPREFVPVMAALKELGDPHVTELYVMRGLFGEAAASGKEGPDYLYDALKLSTWDLTPGIADAILAL